MSFAQAKEIALLRLTLRSCWNAGDRDGARLAYAALASAATASNDNELAAEVRRWAVKLSTTG